MDNEFNENNLEKEEKASVKKKSRIWSVGALIFATLSILLCFFPAVGITLGVVSIALTVISRFSIGYFDNYGIAAIIVGIFGVVFGCAYIIFEIFIAATL